MRDPVLGTLDKKGTDTELRRSGRTRNSVSVPVFPDRKARKEIKIPERWVSVHRQLLLPQPTASDTRPLEVSWVYKGTKS